MAGDRPLTVADLDAMTPNERADIVRAGVVQWEEIPADMQERIRAWAVETTRRRFPAA